MATEIPAGVMGSNMQDPYTASSTPSSPLAAVQQAYSPVPITPPALGGTMAAYGAAGAPGIASNDPFNAGNTSALGFIGAQRDMATRQSNEDYGFAQSGLNLQGTSLAANRSQTQGQYSTSVSDLSNRLAATQSGIAIDRQAAANTLNYQLDNYQIDQQEAGRVLSNRLASFGIDAKESDQILKSTLAGQDIDDSAAKLALRGQLGGIDIDLTEAKQILHSQMDAFSVDLDAARLQRDMGQRATLSDNISRGAVITPGYRQDMQDIHDIFGTAKRRISIGEEAAQNRYSITKKRAALGEDQARGGYKISQRRSDLNRDVAKDQHGIRGDRISLGKKDAHGQYDTTKRRISVGRRYAKQQGGA